MRTTIVCWGLCRGIILTETETKIEYKGVYSIGIIFPNSLLTTLDPSALEDL